MEEFSNIYKILCTLKRIATQLDTLVGILSGGEATKACRSISPAEESGEIRYRVRKQPWDYMSQIAATYSLERAIELCPPGYSVFDAETEEVMYKNIKEQ